MANATAWQIDAGSVQSSDPVNNYMVTFGVLVGGAGAGGSTGRFTCDVEIAFADQPAAMRSKASAGILAFLQSVGYTVATGNLTVPAWTKG